MDTVTESAMAIAMAQSGGIGVIHRNMSIKKQVKEVVKVKKSESGMIIDPITIAPDNTLDQALKIMRQNNISGLPVVDKENNICGILTNRDVRFAKDKSTPVHSLMSPKEKLVVAKQGVLQDEAKQILHQHRIEKLIVVDDAGHCVGLITVRDIQRTKEYPDASKDAYGRLRVAAAVGSGNNGIERAEALIDAGVDAIVVDTAHGHSQYVLTTVSDICKIRDKSGKDIDIIAGNIATGEATKALILAGADAIKVGIGPGSICTTRIITGVGMPQLSAVLHAVEEAKKHNIPIIADGGIRYSGDIAKAITAGASTVMLGSVLAGTNQSPGEVIYFQGRAYKSYRGMGSVGAMSVGSADRYFQKQASDKAKLIPEGVEGRVPYKGDVNNIIHQLCGGLRASMGYTGCGDIKTMNLEAQFVEITAASIKESHAHDITITSESPNYPS
jgi:IMP dehydrogenase